MISHAESEAALMYCLPFSSSRRWRRHAAQHTQRTRVFGQSAPPSMMMGFGDIKLRDARHTRANSSIFRQRVAAGFLFWQGDIFRLQSFLNIGRRAGDAARLRARCSTRITPIFFDGFGVVAGISSLTADGNTSRAALARRPLQESAQARIAQAMRRPTFAAASSHRCFSNEKKSILVESGDAVTKVAHLRVIMKRVLVYFRRMVNKAFDDISFYR